MLKTMQINSIFCSYFILVTKYIINKSYIYNVSVSSVGVELHSGT